MLKRLLNRARPVRARALLALVAAGTLALSACDKAQLLAPSNSTLSMTAGAMVIASGGSTQVQAMVLESAGTPVQNGTTVRFTTTLGRLDPVEAQTRNGVATTTLFGDGASGVAEVRAVSGSASGGTGTTPTNKLSIAVGSGGVGEGGLSIRANPATVPVAGGTVEIIATAVDANNGALSGVNVAFSSDRGTLSAGSAMTNSFGEARVQLTTNRETIVTATVGGRTASVTVKLFLPATVTLSAGSAIAGQPTTLTVTPADGTAPKVVIAWGDGTESDLGIVATERRVTHVYSESGSYAIIATATDNGDTFTNTTTVVVSARPSPTIAVTSAGSTITGAPSVFLVTPPSGGAGIRNVKIDFGDGTEVSLGAVTAATPVSHQYAAAGTYTVRAILTDGTGVDTVGTAIVTVP
ncbi:MAG: PKD domain-containing protein [Vicinamibacterales bacterium]